jgi:hypothetical protein
MQLFLLIFLAKSTPLFYDVLFRGKGHTACTHSTEKCSRKCYHPKENGTISDNMMSGFKMISDPPGPLEAALFRILGQPNREPTTSYTATPIFST